MTDDERPRSHRELAAGVADMIDDYPDSEFTMQFLMGGIIHGILALVDEFADDDDDPLPVRMTEAVARTLADRPAP